jgi:hypothetical protein
MAAHNSAGLDILLIRIAISTATSLFFTFLLTVSDPSGHSMTISLMTIAGLILSHFPFLIFLLPLLTSCLHPGAQICSARCFSPFLPLPFLDSSQSPRGCSFSQAHHHALLPLHLLLSSHQPPRCALPQRRHCLLFSKSSQWKVCQDLATNPKCFLTATAVPINTTITLTTTSRSCEKTCG